MLSAKRVTIATILGVVFGVVCWLFAKSSGPNSSVWSFALLIILSRAVMGFAIGISALRISWWLHGIVMGIIFSLPMAFGALIVSKDPTIAFWGSIGMGIIYAVLIELITSVAFKAKSVAA